MRFHPYYMITVCTSAFSSPGINEFGNSYVYNRTRLFPAHYCARITLNRGLDDMLVFERCFDILSDPLSCAVFLRDEGITFDEESRELTIEFGATGMYDSYSCTTNGKSTPCKLSRNKLFTNGLATVTMQSIRFSLYVKIRFIHLCTSACSLLCYRK